MHCGIQSVSPSLVYYIWIIIPTLSLIHHSKFVDFLIISLLTLSLLFCRRKESILQTFDNNFDVSQINSDFEELAEGFQPKNTVSNS